MARRLKPSDDVDVAVVVVQHHLVALLQTFEHALHLCRVVAVHKTYAHKSGVSSVHTPRPPQMQRQWHGTLSNAVWWLGAQVSTTCAMCGNNIIGTIRDAQLVRLPRQWHRRLHVCH